jgi:hypothetical protein
MHKGPLRLMCQAPLHQRQGGPLSSAPHRAEWTVYGTIYIFRFRSYLVTDVGRILDAKCGCMNFREAYRTWLAKALIKETPRDCTVVIEGVGARYECP